MPEAYEEVHKRCNRVETYLRNVRRIHDRGIMVNGSFVFGFSDPDGPRRSSKTVQFGIDACLDTATFTILTPYPGTTLHDRFAPKGGSSIAIGPTTTRPASSSDRHECAENSRTATFAYQSSTRGRRLSIAAVGADGVCQAALFSTWPKARRTLLSGCWAGPLAGRLAPPAVPLVCTSFWPPAASAPRPGSAATASRMTQARIRSVALRLAGKNPETIPAP